MGWVGQGQYFLAVYFAKRDTRNCGGEKARTGREFLFPQPPFPSRPARAEKVFCSAARSAAIKIRNPDFRQKRFKLHPKNTSFNF